MPAKLYVVPASHPCACVEAALRLKGVAYKRVDLIPTTHVVLQKARFGRRTVPGIVFEDGRKVCGSRAILRELDARVPEPPLLPADPALRARVLEAEAWGDEVLQPVVRRILWAALKRDTGAMMSFAEGSELPLPDAVARRSGGLVAFLESQLNSASDANACADLEALEDHLARIDGWIAEGVIGGAEPNAADLQLGSSLRLLLTVADIAPLIDAHPAGELARRWFPDYPGHVPAGALPAEWRGGRAAISGARA